MVQPLGLAAKWSFSLGPVPTPPFPRLGIDVRSTAYRDCGVLRTPVPSNGCRSSWRLVYRVLLTLLVSPFEAVPPLFLQATELHRLGQFVGCAPDQDLELPRSVQGSLDGLLDWA